MDDELHEPGPRRVELGGRRDRPVGRRPLAGLPDPSRHGIVQVRFRPDAGQDVPDSVDRSPARRLRIVQPAFDVEERPGQMPGQSADPEPGQRAGLFPAFDEDRRSQQARHDLGGPEEYGDHPGRPAPRPQLTNAHHLDDRPPS
jgi:hypothetical protein